MGSSRALQVGGAAAGIGCLAWAIAGASWRNSAGDLTAAVCFPLACTAAAWAVAAAAATSYRYASAWFAVAVIGQAASLQMVEAGPFVRYQHYPAITTLASTHPWLLALIALQTVIVLTALAKRRSGRLVAASERLTARRVVAAILLSVCTAATVSPSVVRYLGELALASSLQVLSIATIVLMGLALPQGSLARSERRLTQVLGPEDDDRRVEPGRHDRFGWTAAAVATLLAVTLNILSYERHPHLADEVADLYHARYFAAGMLTMPAPPSAAAFDVDLMSYEPTRWFSPVAPGWPAMLAMGVLAGLPWLVNPVLAGLNILLTYMLLGDLYPRRLARTATALLAVSPWFLFLGMSFMTHMLTLACGLLAALAVVRARRTGAFAWSVLAGTSIGATSLVRPLDGLIVGVLMVLWSAGVGGAGQRLVSMAGVGVGALAVGALVLPYNYWLLGRAFEFPINAYFDKYYHVNANAYGFGPDRGMGWAIDPNLGHSPIDGLINANLNTFGINTDLFGWSTGSLIFVASLLCMGSLTRSDRLMLATIVTVFVAHFFYYFSGGPDFGARYWFLGVVPLVALTARGIQAMERVAGPRVGLAVAALVATALINFVPWRAIDKYHHYRGMRADVRTLAAERHFARDLVLVRGNRFPDYASAFVENPVDLAGDSTIYAWDRNAAARAEALRAYPDRRVWLVDGPSITGSGYRIAEGPLAAGALMSADASK